MKTFNMIDVGERSCSCIPDIFYVWKKQCWSDPQTTESFEPERVFVSLFIGKIDDKKATIKPTIKASAYRYAIIDYLTENVTAKSSEIVKLIGLKPTRTKEILKEMICEGIIITGGENKNRIYKLKS